MLSFHAVAEPVGSSKLPFLFYFLLITQHIAGFSAHLLPLQTTLLSACLIKLHSGRNIGVLVGFKEVHSSGAVDDRVSASAWRGGLFQAGCSEKHEACGTHVTQPEHS